jgi:hypothetical protein
MHLSLLSIPQFIRQLNCRSISLPLLLILSLLAEGCVSGRIEEPKYDVVGQYGDMEVRLYAPRILAETVVQGNFEQAPTEGFRRIANFIFGNNKPGAKVAMTAPVEVIPSASSGESSKIAMTAPVTQQSSTADSWVITFTMPSSYTMDTMPKPVDDRVTLRELPSAKYVALRFGGFNTRSNVDDAIGRLRQSAEAQGLKMKGEPIYARYNPPWTPWFWRRNEILIEVLN